MIKVDPAEQTISLSIRAVGDKAERAALKNLAAEQASTQTTTLGDLLAEKLGQAASAEAAETTPAAAEESPDTGDEASGPGSEPTEDSSSEEA